MDKLTQEQRSKVMSKIRGKNTRPEILIFNALDKLGIKYEKHYKLLGNPDIVFPKRKDSLPEYWVSKISRNMRRDRKYRYALKKEGWKIIRLWEHSILKNTKRYLDKILKSVELMI